MLQKEILTSPKTTWAIWKLSESASKNIISQIDRNSINTVVEFWPWRGNITQEILNKLWPDWKLICFEINEKDFKQHLDTLQDSRLTIHYTSCEHISEYCIDNSVDLIISTIPISLIDKNIVNIIVNKSYNSLVSGWEFITGQYSSYAKQFMNPIFGNIHKRRHLRNIPPVCILTSKKV